jgi:geranyl-CoA carboxylase beta subunit
VPGGGVLAGIGFVSGVRCMVVASDSGIAAGALQPMGLEKILRVQEIALANRLPFLHLLESAGADLGRYRVEAFVRAGAQLRNLARLSAAGIPVITVLHGDVPADAACMPGLSDLVIAVRSGPRATRAAPPLREAGPGGVGSGEARGAEMPTGIPPRGDYLAVDDRHALGIAREVVKNLAAPALRRPHERAHEAAAPALSPAGEDGGEGAREELLSLMPADLREPVDLREILVRLVDEAALLEFQPLQGAAMVCAQGRIGGHAVGFVGNNGPIDAAGADKATRFIRWMGQLGHPLVFLQNTTGWEARGQGGPDAMVRHASAMIQAATQATVPQLTLQCGASYGAGNYGMCGRGLAPRFLFSWPGARTAPMDGEQAARSQARFAGLAQALEAQADAFHTSGLLLDDGVIDPRDTRAVLAFCLDTLAEAAAKPPRPAPCGGANL